MLYELHHGDCLQVMRGIPNNSVDAIVTDPPYELGFMGNGWDKSGIANNVEMWCEALRVLKPGGHLLAFSGSRTYHRMASAIEDAGFEIRDQIMWLYGSGFPKSLDVSKAIDKAAGAERERYERPAFGGAFSDDDGTTYGTAISNAPVTDAAKQWQGWGTALKPAHEPICVARKPLQGTVAQNVLTHGTGALNIDGCRIGNDVRVAAYTSLAAYAPGKPGTAVARRGTQGDPKTYVGRWPANVIHDGSDDVVAAFPQVKSGGNVKGTEPSSVTNGIYGGFESRVPFSGYQDAGSAARFFYCAKASRSDRGDGNTHPTVKPTDLMAYLVRLVTPPGGLVLDPFMGSGSTGKACMREGMRFIGIELSAEYLAIARVRIEHAAAVPRQLPLIGAAA